MDFRIKKRLALVMLVVLVQAICLLLAILVFSTKMRSSIRQTVHDQVLADNIQTARQMTSLIRQMEVDNIRDDLESWKTLQESVRDIRLPNEGFVCLTDSTDGSLLCHPALTNHPILSANDEMVKPGMAKPGMVKPEMVKPEMVKPEMKKPPMVTLGDDSRAANGDSEISGSVVEYNGELQIIAAAKIPEMNATVNVHQKASGIESNISEVMKPVLPLGIAISLGSLLVTSGLILSLVRRYENRLAEINEGLEETVYQRTQTLSQTRDAVIYGLAKLAESRDTDTGEHLDRIRLYVMILGVKLAKTDPMFTRSYLDTLSLASSLHDIGKVGISDAVLLKPGKFTPAERKSMEMHSKIGGNCLKAIGDRLGENDFLQMARDIAFCHHEKWDGTGYPFRINGEAIPLSARIVALADVYDALRSRRPYKEPMSHEEAKQIIVEGRGTHFDPKIVDAFLSSEHAFNDVAERFNFQSNNAPERMTEDLVSSSL